MSKSRKIIGAFLIALCMSITTPAALPLATSVNTVVAAKIKLSKSKATLIKGQTLTLKMKNTSKKVKWSTSSKKIATVNSKGKITAKKAGTATITAKVNNKKYKCKVTVETPKISQSTLVVEKGKTAILTLNGTKQKVKWTTSNKSIATVSSKGVVTGKSAGTAKITAAVGNKKYNCNVTVKNVSTTPTNNDIAVKNIVLDKSSYTLKLGNTLSLNATVSPSNATNKAVTWSSSNSNVVTVSETGLVTAINGGTAKITAKAETKSATCTITVDDYGARTNPISAYSSNEFNLYDSSKFVGKFKLELKECLVGTSAEQMFSSYSSTWKPSDHQWVYMLFDLSYIAGIKEVSASTVLWYSDFYNSSSNKNISNYESGFVHDSVTNVIDLSMYPGGRSDFYIMFSAPLKDLPLTYRISTGYNNENYESIYTWFATK